MVSNILKVVLIIGIILAVGYAAVACYVNFGQNDPNAPPTMPDVREAAYTLQIKNTGSVVLAKTYEQIGDTIGKRIYILNGYWEISGNDFVYNDTRLIMNEKTFGEIVVRHR